MEKYLPQTSEQITAVHAHIDQHFDDHLETIRRIIQQRSISADGDGIPQMATMLAERLQELGAQAESVETEGFPVVYGHLDAGAERTLMVYGMYDTMPVAGETWQCDPFAAEIIELPEVGASIVARGAENSKGSLASFLNMLDSWRAVHGRYPVNLKFVYDGEEELGSPSLPGFVEAYKNQLQADACVFPGLSQARSGKPVLKLGFKGILFLELYLSGGDWGGPRHRAAHSSRAVWYASPTIAMVHALGSLFSPDQRKVLIDGFYDDVAPIPPEDERLLQTLAETFDAEEDLAMDGVSRYKWDLEGVELLKKYLYEPSLNIAGLISGDTGPGAKTILPHDAFAKIGFRFVPNQTAERILDLLQTHFRKAGFPQVEIHLHDTTNWTRTSVNALPVQASIQACRDFGYEPEVWPTQAGSSPVYLFTQTLGMPATPAGLGHGGGAHGPNEYATVDGLRLCEKSLASFLGYFAAA
jgi:acetylornithine deacetylase/succinyl-diaminopimelate desuccinylase-like protein